MCSYGTFDVNSRWINEHGLELVKVDRVVQLPFFLRKYATDMNVHACAASSLSRGDNREPPCHTNQQQTKNSIHAAKVSSSGCPFVDIGLDKWYHHYFIIFSTSHVIRDYAAVQNDVTRHYWDAFQVGAVWWIQAQLLRYQSLDPSLWYCWHASVALNQAVHLGWWK